MSSSPHRYNLRKRTGPTTPTRTTRSSSSTTQEKVKVDTNGSHTPTKKSTSSSTTLKNKKDESLNGTNWVHGGGIEANPYLFVLIVVSPFLSLLLAYITSVDMAESNVSFRVTHPLTEMLPACLSNVSTCLS